MKYISQILLILLFTLASSCSKYDCDDCIYFRCKVDGKEWRMNCNTSEPFGCSAYDARYYHSSSKNLNIRVKNDKVNSNIKLRVRSVKELHKDYNLGELAQQLTFYAGGDNDFRDTCLTYDIDTTEKINIITLTTLDTTNFIVAGRFAFTGYDRCGHSVNIADGEFRLNYSY